jgi:hypothetical protein
LSDYDQYEPKSFGDSVWEVEEYDVIGHVLDTPELLVEKVDK